MKTTFSQVLARFSALSQLANSESESIHNLIVGPDQPLDAFSPEALALLREPAPCAAALAAFLAALPNEFVFALTALLYSGRDEEDDPVDYWSDLRKTITSKERAIESLTEKFPRMKYIEAAITKLPSSMLLDEIPQQIASL
ncbi:MAG: hypothetical protein M0Q22_12090 [Sulfuritalea sp.]|jgi:hypothetical protein|nr:hypothetical protein [Sulfuritalea sp.]